MNRRHPFAFDHRNRHYLSSFHFPASGDGGGDGFECPAYSWSIIPSSQYVAHRLHIDGWTRKSRSLFGYSCDRKADLQQRYLFFFQVLESILACDKDIFSWSFNRCFGPLRSLLSLASSLNRMIRGSNEYYRPIVRKQTSLTVGIVGGVLTKVKPVFVPSWYLKGRLFLACSRLSVIWKEIFGNSIFINSTINFTFVRPTFFTSFFAF